MARLASASEIFTIRGIIVILLSASVLAGPTGYRSTPTCATYCKDAKKFQYETGNTYVYDYSTDIRTQTLDEASQDSRVQLTSKVEIETISSCDFKFKLKDVQISEGNEDNDRLPPEIQDVNYFANELEKFSTHFAFQDGKVDHLCSNPNEPIWVTNVKRGILSMLQNTMEDISVEANIQEVDVNGKCRTHYKPSSETSWGGATVVRKVKDLSTCINRPNQITTIQSIPFNNGATGMGILAGAVECSQVIRNNKFETVQCQEEQKFKPFENQNSGAKNVISQTLKYSTMYASKSSSKDSNEMIKKNLLFEIDTMVEGNQKDLTALINLLEKLEKASTPIVQAEAPALFIELVEEIRQLGEQGLRSLLTKTTNATTKKFLLDAIPLANSAASIALMRDFFLQGELTNDQLNTWLSSVTFIKYPTLSMISNLLPLLEREATSPVLLSLSSLINSYCKTTTDCLEDEVIQQVMNKITEPLGNDCVIFGDIHQVRQTVLALKAVGNTGIYPTFRGSSSDSPILQKCLLQKSNPVEVRLAAIDAHRRISCSSFSNEPLLATYAAADENTEIRINAYLVAMNCADRKTIETVKTVMHTEVVNQVGSFVWTHLTNLQETNRPDKQLIKSLVLNESLKNKFKTDARKFSRNYESSAFWDELNAGAGIDANVIFTEESFLPKSGMVNLTVQMFGKSVNLFEFGGRFHATERLLEPIFGPNGYFPDESMTEFLKNTRRKRDVSDNEIERLPSVYEQASTRVETIPGGSFYARIFGHEVLYKDFEVNTDSNIPTVVDENGKNWFNIRNILDNLSTGKKSEFTKSTILMDISYSVPTSAGIPLTLGFKAAATVGLTAEGKFNVGKFIEKKELEIHGFLKPNTAVDVDASLTIRLGARNRYVRSGLAVRNVLRSSTAVETKLVIDGYNIVKAAVNLPQDRQEIFEATSKVLLLRASGNQVVLEPPSSVGKIENKICIGESYADILGLKLCGEISIPDSFTLTPNFPAFAVLYVEKTDNFKGYSVDFNYDDKPSSTKMSIVFDTPGSTINRRTSVKFNKETLIGRFHTSIDTPSKSIKAVGTYTQFHKSFDLIIVDDGEKLLQINSSLHHVGNKIEPNFVLHFFKRPMAELKGFIEIPNGNGDQKKANIDLVLKHVTQNPIRIHGNFIANGDMHEATLGVESYFLTGTVRSHIKRRHGHLSTKSILEYSWKHGESVNVDISAKLQRTLKGALSKYNAAAGFTMSNYPDSSVEFSWETQTSGGFCENTAKFSMGKSVWEGHTLFNRQNSRDLNELRVQVSLANTRNEIDYFLEFSHRMMEDSINTKLIGRTSAENEVKANFDYISDARPFLMKNITAEASWPGAEYSFRAALQEKQKGEFQGELLINLNKQKEMKATVSYINNSSNLKLDHTLDFRARGFSSVPISGSLAFTATDKQSHAGCQIQFEGKKPYSSRLSTSIDYSHTKNTHKLEAKVTFNEKKYNGEITFAHIKSGTRHLMVDLYFDNHIFMDAKLTGTFPEAVTASFALIPDKDNNPSDKLEIRGSLDSGNMGVYLNYFGEKMSFNGGIGNGGITAEALWSAGQRLMISAKAPKMTVPHASASLFIITPLEGFRNVSAFWEHFFVPDKWESRFEGNIEEKSAALQFNALRTPSDLSAVAIADLSGYPRLESNIVLIKDSSRNIVQLIFKKGSAEGLMSVEFLTLPDTIIFRVDFKGCKYLPEILLEWNNQLLDRQITTFQLAWALPSSTRNVIHLELEKRFDPLFYRFSIATPWETWKSIVGRLTLDNLSSMYRLEVTNTGDLNVIPSKLGVGIQGTLMEFEHYATLIWKNQKTEMSVQGGINGMKNTDIEAILKIHEHNYTIKVLSKQNTDLHKAELNVDFDNSKSNLGLKWNLGSNTGKHELSIWGNLPSEPEKKATLAYDTDSTINKFNFEVRDKDKPLLTLEGDINSAGYDFWSTSVTLKSFIQSIPSFTWKSNHNMFDVNNIHHENHLTIIPNEGSYLTRVGVLPGRNFSINFDITDLEKVVGFAMWDDKSINIEGEIHPKSHGHDLSLQMKSSQFSQIEVETGYQLSEQDFRVAGLVKYSNSKMFEADIGAEQLDGTYSGSLFIASPYFSTLDGQISADVERGMAKIFLKKNQLYILNLNAIAQGTLMEGKFETTIKSSVFSSIENILIQANYRLQQSSLTFEGKYETNAYRYQLGADGAWTEEKKNIRLSSDGEFVGTFEVSLENLNKLHATLTYNQRKLGELQLQHSVSMSDFAWGTHTVVIQYINSNQKQTDLSVSLGVDPKRFNLEITTPFARWTQMKLYGQLDVQSTASKVIRFGLHREQDKLDSAFEMKAFKRNATTTLSTEVSVVGFAELRKFIVETTNLTNIPEGFATGQQETFSARVRWSQSNIDLQVVTPMQTWKNIKLNGNWELNRVQKFIHLKSSIDDQPYEVRGATNYKLGSKKAELQFLLKTLETYQADLKFDFSKQYEAELKLIGPALNWNLEGKLGITDKSISIEAKTPFRGYEDIKGVATFEKKSPTHQIRSLKWTLNTETKEIYVETILNEDEWTLNLRLPVEPWSKVVLTLKYDTPLKELQFKGERGDGKRILLTMVKDTVGNLTDLRSSASSKIDINVVTPFEGFEEGVLSINYDRVDFEHKATFDFGKNNDEMNGQLNFLYRSKEPLTIDINSRLSLNAGETESKAHATLLVDPNGRSTFTALVETDEVKHEADAALEITQGTKILSIQTSLPFLKKIYLSINHADETSLRGLWEGNNMKSEIQSTLYFKGLSEGKLKVSLTSPISGLKNVQVDSSYNIKDGKVSSDISFQNEDSRWLAKGEGTYDQSSGEWNAQMKTPVEEYQDLTMTLKHSWTAGVKEIVCSFGQNSGKRMELEASLKDTGLQVALQSEIFRYPLAIHSSIQWAKNPKNFQLTLGAGDEEYKTNFEISVQGFESGMIHIRTALLPEINSRLAWKAEGNFKEGNAWVSVTNTLIGTKSLRTLWKAEGWNMVKAEAWMRSHDETEERGGLIQYSLNSDRDGNKKFNAQFSYALEKGVKIVTGIVTLKQTDTKYEGDLKLETPLQALRKIVASGELVIGSEIAINFNANHNDEHALDFDGSLELTKLKSSLKANLNAPIICKPFQLLAYYDLLTEKRALELYFKQATYLVNLKSNIMLPTASKEAEIDINLYSNVPSAKMTLDGNLKGSYQVHSNGISEVVVLMDLSQVGNWNFSGALRPDTDFHLKLKLDSGAPQSIPSTTLEANWRGNFRQGISSDLSFIYADQEYKGTFSGSMDNFRLSVTTPIEGFNKISVEGLWQLNSENKDVQVKAKVDGKEYAIVSHCNFSGEKQTGTARVRLTNVVENKEIGLVEFEREEAGKVELKGSYEDHEIKLRGHAIPTDNNVWYQSGSTELSLVVDGYEQITINEAHHFMKNDYSFNISAGPSHVLKVHLFKGTHSTITSTVQWNTDGRLKILAELKSDRVDIFFSSPWTEDTALHGMFQTNSAQTTVDGYLLYGKKKSTIKVKTSSSNEASSYEVSLDIPTLQQKLDTTISVQAADAYRSGGKIDMVMNGRHISLGGQLSTKVINAQSGGRQDESKLSLSFTLPSQEIPEIATQITVRRPVNHFGSMKINGRLNLRDKVSDLSIGYDLPIFGSKLLGFSASLKNPYNEARKYELHFQADKSDFKKFTGHVAYNFNELTLNWNFALPQVNAIFRLITSRSGYDINEYSISTQGFLDTSKLLNVSVDAVCKQKTLNFRSSIVREDQMISSEIAIISPYLLGVPHNYKLELVKKESGKYAVEISGSQGRDSADLMTEIYLKDSAFNANGKITGSFGSHYAKLDYDRKDNEHEVVLTLESTTLLAGKKASMRGTLSQFENGFEAKVLCQTRKSTHKASLSTLMKPEVGSVTFKVESPDLEPLSFHTEWLKEGSKFTGSMRGVYFDVVNEMDGLLNLKNLEGKVTISSPLIPSSHFNVHLKSIVANGTIDILGDVKIRDSHWHLEGVLQYESLRRMNTKLEILTPYKSFDGLTLALKSSEDEIYTELYTPISIIPDAMLRISGIGAFQKGSWQDMHPSITVKLPFGKYSSFAVVKMPSASSPGIGHIFFEDQGSTPHQTYELKSEISPLSHFSLNMENIGVARIRLITPVSIISSLEAGIEGKINGKNLVKINAEGNLNDDKLAFVFDYQNDDGNPKVSSELTTPFKHFEQFALSMSVGTFQKIGTGKSFHMEFARSDWNEEIKLDADYRYQFNGFLDMEGEVNAVLVALLDTVPFHADIKTTTKDSKLTGILSGNSGAQKVTLQLEAEMSEDELLASLDGKFGVVEDPSHLIATVHLQREANAFSFRKEVLYQDEKVLFIRGVFSPVAEVAGGEFKLSTPWGPLEATTALIPVSPFLAESGVSFDQLLTNMNTTFNLKFDDWRIVGFQLVSKDGHATVEVYNPIRPIYLMMNFEHLSGSKTKIISEFCWDLEQPVGNTVGITFVTSNSFTGRNFAFKIQAEQAGFVEFLVDHFLTSSKLDQNVMMRWNSPLFNTEGATGYHMILAKDFSSQYQNNDFSFQLDFPWRSIMVETHSNKTNKELLRTLIFKWDLNKNDDKFVSMKLHKEVKTAWKVSESSHYFELVHPLSEQPLMVSLDQIFKDDRFQHIELDIKTSQEPQSNFVFLISRNKTDWKNCRVLVRHVPTKLSTELNVKSTEEQMAIELSYMDVTGTVRNVQADVAFLPQGFSFDMHTGDKDNKLEILKVQNINQQDRILVNLQLISMEVDLLAQKSLPYVEAVVKHEGEDRVRVSGGFYHSKEIGLKVTRSDFGKVYNYILVTLKLNGSNALSSRINWLPEIFSNLMELDIPKIFGSTISQDINLESVLKTVRSELEGRWNTVSPSIRSFVKGACAFVCQEAKLVYQEWKKVADYIGELYENNSFYLKDICDAFGIMFDIAKTLNDTVVKELIAFGKAISQTVWNGIMKANEIYQKYEGKLEKAIMDWWNQIEAFVNTIWRDNLYLISSIIDNFEKVVETSLYALEGKVDEIEKKLMAVGLIKKVIQIYKEYSTWIEEIPIQQYVQNIEKMLSVRIWDRLAEHLSPLIDAIRNGVEDQYFRDLLETPPLPYIRYVLKTFNTAFGKFWEALEVEQRIKNLVRTSLKNVDGLLHRYIPAGSFIFDLDKGVIEYDQSLSALQWEDFTKLPRWKTSKEDAEDVNQLSNFYYQVMDKIESLKPLLDMNIRSILPPFGSYALMAGDYHYFTFDKKYFRFAGECSYLLVADLSHSENAFSLIVNYENRAGSARKKSYTITSEGKVLDIDISNFKVTINGKKADLPLIVGSTYFRRHQTGLEIFDKRGFQMSCSLSPSVCTVWVSGWHFGKLGGLLGTYDYEQINDLQNPQGQIIPDVSTFAYSWRVGKNSGICRMKNFARDETIPVDIDNICHNLLSNRSSPLRPCFNTVNTEIFINMCLYDVSRNINSANRAEAACPAMSAYVAECQKNSVDVWMPPTCVRCRLEDGTALTTGENATLEVHGERRPPQSSDNIILLEESSCVSSDSIAEAVRRLDLALTAQGIEENRYAIVGFGGNGLHEKPHIKTTSSRVWAHSTLFKIPNDTDTSTTTNGGDLYEAIQYAATLGFRAGVSKNIIAVTCASNRCGDSSRYADILTLLVENDIKLHILAPSAFTLKGNRKQDETDQIVGIDMNGVYTTKHAKMESMEPDKALRRQINVPKDLCTPLAMESNGTRFNIERPSKKVLDVWSRRVAQTSHPSECQRCECVPDRYGSASLMCHQCVSPSLWRFMEEWKSYQTLEGDDEPIPFDFPLDHDEVIFT